MTGPILLFAVAIFFVALAVTFRSHTIQTGSVGLMFRNGVFERQLEPGRHRYVDPLGRTTLRTLPTTSSPTHPFQMSLMSKDQFSFRLSVVAVRKITDARLYSDSQPAPAQGGLARMIGVLDSFATDRLQPELAAALIAWAGTQALEDIVDNPAAGLEGLAETLGLSLPGVSVEKLLITELTVPPEVRKMFTEVERARREGLAQLERARGEQASLRALANAARSLNGNPQLAQLRLLQTMESAKGAKTFVMGRPADQISDTSAPSDSTV